MNDNKHITAVVSLEDVRLAKQLQRDVPEIKKIVDNFIKLMQPYKEYLDVAKAIRQADESIITLETFNYVYSNYLPGKGKKQ